VRSGGYAESQPVPFGKILRVITGRGFPGGSGYVTLQ
jgi:hypothetical protein